MARSPGGRQQDFCIKQDGCLLERILASYSTYALCLLFDSGMSAYMTEVLTTAAHCHVPESISNAPLGLTLAQACLAINFSRTSFELHKGGAARTIPVEGKTPGLDGLSYQSNRRHFRHAGVARLDQAHQIAQHTCRSCPSLEQPTRLESVVEPDKNGVSIHGEHFHVGGTPVIEYRPSEKPCLVCGNLEWNRLPSDTSVRYGEERRLGMTSTVLERSALLDSCDTCRLLHIGIRNFAETLTAETYRKRLQDFDRDYMIWIKLRRDKCLRLLIYDAEGDSQRTVRGVGVFGGPLIIDLDFYGPSCHPAPWPALRAANHVPSMLTLERAIAMAKSWIHECSTIHSSCHQVATPSILPARILDVSCGVKLLVTDSLRGTYTTLSHCWGNPTWMIKTTRENLELRKSDIPWSTIPEAFQDAIRITRGLGCKYIWIDSLCIIQDDEQDWARESGKMAETYSASYLNIAATEYADPMPWRQYGSQKLLKERSRLEGTSIGGESIIEPARIPVTYDGRNMDVLVRQAPFIAHDDILGKDHGLEIGASPTCWVSPLFRRAWVFQERLLAPRTIFFHHEETVWECRSRINCECGEVDGARLDDDELPNDRQTSLREGLVALDEAGSDAQDMFDLWLDIIQGYSLLELSKESDRLAALSGLASRLSHQFQSTYVAGLWKEDLARSLLWSREPWQITTPSEYYTPSWSWISGRHFSYLVTSNIRYDYVQDHNFAVDSRFQALEIDCAPRSARDPFGRVESGTLKLCGALVMVTIHTAVGGSKMRLAPNLLEHDGDENPFRDDYGQAHSCHTATVDEVFCLLVGEASRTSINEDAHSLALVISRQPSGVYQRLGLLALPKRKRWFDDAAVIEVSLT